MTDKEKRKRIHEWFDRSTHVKINHAWNGVQRGDPAVWDATGERCTFVAHATDESTRTEWWTFASPNNNQLMHATSVYFVWADGPPLHGVL